MKDESEDEDGLRVGLNRRDVIDRIGADRGKKEQNGKFIRPALELIRSFRLQGGIYKVLSSEKTGEQTFADAFNIAQEYVAKRFRLLDLYWLIGGLEEFRDACEKLHFFADQLIDRNLSHEMTEDKGSKYVFLRAMAKKTPNRTALRSQIINILTAVLSQLALRLCPPMPVNARTALCTTVLPLGDGLDRKSPVLIPKGSSVAYSVYTMHRRPGLLGIDAGLFCPERWDEQMALSQNETDSKWGYLPFNGRLRICLGMDFALTKAAYTIVRIIQKFPTIKLPKVIITRGGAAIGLTIAHFATARAA
ncbi:hypothetical protein V499_00255 [Pseudogymnoascus sp. VKM F-103]|nr:hypothetical protein V499_00255 [Pseudogymnoascus sp. VKM F-103]